MPPRNDVAIPLSESEHAEASQVARRLRDELRELIAAADAAGMGASELARHTGIDRSICQRVLAACADDAPAVSVLMRAPGVKGLRRFIACAKSAGADVPSVRACGAAADEYEQVLRRLGGSQARATRRIEATLRAEASDRHAESASDEHVRAELHRAAVALMGRETETVTAIHMLRLNPTDPARIEVAGTFGQIGIRLRRGGMPLTSSIVSIQVLGDASENGSKRTIEGHYAEIPERDDDPDAMLTGDTLPAGPSVLPSFSTRPLPIVTSRDVDGQLVHVIDPDRTLEGRPLDIVTANRLAEGSDHPTKRSMQSEDLFTMVRHPARWLLSDVYMERALYRSSIPSAHVSLWSPTYDFGNCPRWFDLYPGGVALEVMGRGIIASPHAAYARQGDLAAHMFARLGWDPDAFLAFRMAVRYPIWGGCYCAKFDYSPT